MQIKNIIFFYLLFLLPPSIAFSSPLQDFSANYQVYHNGFHIGDASRKLIRQGNNYTYTSTMKTVGLTSLFFDIAINETSKLQLKNKQMNFISYENDETNNGKREEYEFKLNNSQQVYNSYTKKHYPATKKLQAVFGFAIALMHDMQKGKREVEYSILEKERFNTFQLKFIKEEKINSKNGYINTLKMEYYDKTEKFTFTIWAAKEMEFLPIRVRKINNKGDEDIFNLTQYNKRRIELSLDDEETD